MRDLQVRGQLAAGWMQRVQALQQRLFILFDCLLPVGDSVFAAGIAVVDAGAGQFQVCLLYTSDAADE